MPSFRNLTFYFLTLVFQLNLLSAQTILEQNKRFDSIFYDTAVRVSAQDIDRASEIADSLFHHSSSEIHKLKALMLCADLLEKQDKREQAIAFVLRAESIAITIEDYQWQARIYGFLSTQYRIIGLIDQGKRYLEKGLNASEKVTPKSASNQYLGMVHQEMAHYAMLEENYAEAVRLLNDVPSFFSGIADAQLRNFFMGNNEEMLGRSYLGLKQYPDAIKHYKQSLEFLEDANAAESQWAGMIYHGLGKIALENRQYQRSFHYLSKADTIATLVDHTYLKGLVYRDLADYYKITGDIENYVRYNTAYLKNVDQKMQSTKLASNGAINRMYHTQLANISDLHMIIIVIAILLIFSVMLYYYTIRKRKKEKLMYRTALAKLKAYSEQTVPADTVLNSAKENRLMSEETELALLQKLDAFELKNQFTIPSLNLSSLAVDLQTNTKYLSYIINTHKGKDFNNYINDLRVYYIMKVIQNNPEYLNYKISYLSTECGFSSHSKFTHVFKNTTGLTPSAFLNHVRKSNQQKIKTIKSI